MIIKLLILITALVITFYGRSQNTFPSSGNVGIGTTTPTHHLTLQTSSSGIALYNSGDGNSSNYERAKIYWSNNIFNITNSDFAGTGTANRQIAINGGGRIFTIGVGSNALSGFYNFNANTGFGGNHSLVGVTGTQTHSGSVIMNGFSFLNTFNQTGLAGFRELWISPYIAATHTATGVQYLMDVGINSAPDGLGTHTSKFLVTSSGNVGISTTTPTQKLEVNGNILSNYNGWKPYGFYTSKHANFFTQNAYYDGTWKSYLGGGEYSKASICAASTADDCAFGVMVDNNITSANEPLDLSTNLFTVKTTGNVIIPGKILIGNVDESRVGSYALAVNGTGIFTKVQVKATGNPWPDYVFHPSYSLRSLSSLETYIKENKHLPDVPSAEEVENNGVDVGATQAILLRKIEELTLYVIEQGKRIERLESGKRSLKSENKN
jgi:hypothetical protein